jgi:hypothetical protein
MIVENALQLDRRQKRDWTFELGTSHENFAEEILRKTQRALDGQMDRG